MRNKHAWASAFLVVMAVAGILNPSLSHPVRQSITTS